MSNIDKPTNKRIRFKISKYTAQLYKDKTGNDPPMVKEVNNKVVSSSKVVGKNIKELYSSLIDQDDSLANHEASNFDDHMEVMISARTRLHTHQYCKTV